MKKLTLSLMIVILFAIVGLGWGLDQLFSQYQNTEKNITESNELTPYITMGSLLAKSIDLQNSTEQFMSDWSNPNKISLSVTYLQDFPLPQSLQHDFIQGKPLTLESDDNISIHFILSAHQKVLTLTLDRTLLEKDNTLIQIMLTLVFYIGIIIVVLVWLYPLIRDLQALKSGANEFGKGELGRRVDSQHNSYISDLQAEFNSMASRIQTLVSDNKMLGNAVSHDLRTPLARLRFGIEMLQDTVDLDKRKKYENRMSDDIDEMEKLVEILLGYARIEQAMIAIEKREIDLYALMNECSHSFEIQHNSISWADNIQPASFPVLGDIKYLSMLINNLIKNAVQYSKSQVNLSLAYANGQVVMSVEDDGLGIPEDKRSHLLQPFTRGDEHLETSGFGMGLAIVDRIAQWHDAQLVINDSLTLGGAKFSVVFNCK